jgi:hypothetical protein
MEAILGLEPIKAKSPNDFPLLKVASSMYRKESSFLLIFPRFSGYSSLFL